MRHLLQVFIYAPVPLSPLAARGWNYYARTARGTIRNNKNRPFPAWNGRFCRIHTIILTAARAFSIFTSVCTPPGSPSRVKGTGSAKVKRTVRALRIDIISPL